MFVVFVRKVTVVIKSIGNKNSEFLDLSVSVPVIQR